MKRLLILLFGAMIAMAMIGCGDGGADPDAPKGPAKLQADKNKPASNTNPGSNAPSETL